MKAIKFVIFIMAVSLLGGCAAALVGGGAAGGYYAEKHKTSIKHYAGDAAITSKVKAKYLKDLALKSFAVSVSTNRGVVSLVGNVPTVKLRDRAIFIAKHTSGVKGVDAHNLTVAHKAKAKAVKKVVAKKKVTVTKTTTTKATPAPATTTK